MEKQTEKQTEVLKKNAAEKFEFTREGVERAIEQAILYCATHPRADVLDAIKVAHNFENSQAEKGETNENSQPSAEEAHGNTHARATQQSTGANAQQKRAAMHARATHVLDQIIENAQIAHADSVPICQDTGSVWVRLEVGRDAASQIPTNILDGVNNAVARAYEKGRLRMSILHDALSDRTNTKTNTPAFTEIAVVPGNKVMLHVMLKGGGSDNASRVCMLPPSAGKAGIKEEVIKCVREKAANACPPLVIGVGVGATFDKVAGLAKHALLRPVDSGALLKSIEPNKCCEVATNNRASGTKGSCATECHAIKHAAERAASESQKPHAVKRTNERAAFEAELLRAVNETGIGPGALGGSVTALAVHIETAPCHIAALPLAINMGCSAMRSASIELSI